MWFLNRPVSIPSKKPQSVGFCLSGIQNSTERFQFLLNLKTHIGHNFEIDREKYQNSKDIPSPSICQFVYLPLLELLGKI